MAARLSARGSETAMDTSKAKARIAELMKRMEELSKKEIKVGWLESAKYDESTQVAQVAATNEFGSPANHIPPRPFFRPAIEEHGKNWIKTATLGAKKVIKGDMSAEQVLDAVGQLARADVQQKIASIRSPALSPITLILRKWRREGRAIGEGSIAAAVAALKAGETYDDVPDQPLNDTGHMIATLTSVVVDKEA